MDHEKMSKFLVSHGIQIFIIFCEVELPIRKKYNGGTSLMSAIMALKSNEDYDFYNEFGLS